MMVTFGNGKVIVRQEGKIKATGSLNAAGLYALDAVPSSSMQQSSLTCATTDMNSSVCSSSPNIFTRDVCQSERSKDTGAAKRVQLDTTHVAGRARMLSEVSRAKSVAFCSRPTFVVPTSSLVVGQSSSTTRSDVGGKSGAQIALGKCDNKLHTPTHPFPTSHDSPLREDDSFSSDDSSSHDDSFSPSTCDRTESVGKTEKKREMMTMKKEKEMKSKTDAAHFARNKGALSSTWTDLHRRFGHPSAAVMKRIVE